MRLEKQRRGATLVLAAIFGVLGVLTMAGERPDAVRAWGVGLELLTNGDFEGLVKQQTPTDWFKAMSPAHTERLRAGIEEVPQRGKVAFIEQTGVKIKLANNWAQRVRTIPAGTTVRVTADVKTQDVSPDSGFVMVQCWDEAQRLVGGASSQSVRPIGGSEDWRQISFEFAVPLDTAAMILRCGLSQSGKIWFDNISMRAISSAGPTAGRAGGFPGRGFQVTEESLGQLARVTAFSDGLAAYAQRDFGAEVRVRREVFAQGDGQFRVVLLLDLSKPE